MAGIEVMVLSVWAEILVAVSAVFADVFRVVVACAIRQQGTALA